MHRTRQETAARLIGRRTQVFRQESFRAPDWVTHLVVLTEMEKLAVFENLRN